MSVMRKFINWDLVRASEKRPVRITKTKVLSSPGEPLCQTMEQESNEITRDEVLKRVKEFWDSHGTNLNDYDTMEIEFTKEKMKSQNNTHTGVAYMSQEKVNDLHNSIIEQLAEESGWNNPPIGEYNALINPKTGKVEVKAVDEAHENKKFAEKLKEIIEDCLKKMPKEDWIEVNFEVKKEDE